MEEELIEIVDDDDNVTSTMLRSEAAAQNLLNFRAIYAWVKNSKGELYVPTRSRTKTLYPGGYDFSVSGQVSVGESYEDAFRRETMEELQFNVDDYNWREIAKFTPKQNGVACFIKLFEVIADIQPEFNQDDIEAAEWFTPKQLLMSIYHGHYFKPDIPMTLRMYYDYTK
jgi:isopentenyldiphosphate isomerase